MKKWLQKKGTGVIKCRGGRDSHGKVIVVNGTALHWAVYYGQLEIAQLLIENRAGIYVYV